MDYQTSFAISAAGMSLERLRLDVTSLNLANANVSAPDVGHLYQPQRVVASLNGNTAFARMFDGAMDTPLPELSAQVLPNDAPARVAYEPGHPHADKNGMVLYPGVNLVTEMVGMVAAVRSYEANVVAFNAAKVMSQKALDLGAGR